MATFPINWFKKVGVTHDGLCGYRSVAHQLLGDEKQAGNIIDGFLQLLKGTMALLPEQRDFLLQLKQGYDLFLQKSKDFKGWDSKYWMTSDILDAFAKTNRLVFLILKAGGGRRREYEAASACGDFQGLLKGQNISVYYLRYEEDKFEPLLPIVEDSVGLVGTTMKCLGDIVIHSPDVSHESTDSTRTSPEDTSDGSPLVERLPLVSFPCADIDSPIASPLLFEEQGRARTGSATEIERELSASPGYRDDVACIQEKLKSNSLPKGPKIWHYKSFNECREENPFLQLPGGRLMQLQRVNTKQRPMNKGGRRLYTCDLLKARALYNVWQYFAVSDNSETWVSGSVLWPKSEEPAPNTDEELTERLQALGTPLTLLGAFWTTNCGKDVEVVGNLEKGFTQFKENPKFKLSDYICLDFLPRGVTLEKIIASVHDMVDKTCLTYDKSRSDVQFFGRSANLNEELSSESESESPANKTVQRQYQGRAISFIHVDDHPASSVQNNLGDFGIYFNAIKAGSEMIIEFGSFVTIDGLKNNPSTRFIYVGCLETAAPVDSSAKFNYFIFCTAQRALFCTHWSKMKKAEPSGVAAKKDMADANALLVAYVQESASRNKRSMRRLPIASSETVSPMSNFIPKKDKEFKVKPAVKKQKKAKSKATAEPIKIALTSRNPTRAAAAKTTSLPPSDELAQLQAQIIQLQQDLERRNKNPPKVEKAPEPMQQTRGSANDSAELFFEYFFFDSASKSFGSWKRLYDHQYQRFCVSKGLEIVQYKQFKAASLDDEGEPLYFRQRSQSPMRQPRVQFLTDDDECDYTSDERTLPLKHPNKYRSTRPKLECRDRPSIRQQQSPECVSLPPPQAFSPPQQLQYHHVGLQSPIPSVPTYGAPFLPQYHSPQQMYAPPQVAHASLQCSPQHPQYAHASPYHSQQSYAPSYPQLPPQPPAHMPFGYGHY